MNFRETEAVGFECVGDSSGEKYFGTLNVLKYLTHGAQIKRESIIREILGPNSQDASPRTRSQAAIVAELRVSLVNPPEWLKESSFGLETIDDNLLAQLDLAVSQVREKAEKESKARVESARKGIVAELKDSK